MHYSTISSHEPPFIPIHHQQSPAASFAPRFNRTNLAFEAAAFPTIDVATDGDWAWELRAGHHSRFEDGCGWLWLVP